MDWIEPEHADLPLTRQCELAGVPRATVYRRLEAMVRQQREDHEDDLMLRALIDEEYTSRPFYGSRRMAVFLRASGHVVNRKRVQRLMREMGLAGMAPGPNTSKRASAAQGLSVPAARRGGDAAEPGVVDGHDVHPAGAGLRLPGGDHRLVLPQGAVLAHQQQHGRVVLRGLPGGRLAPPRQARGVQQRPGLAVHQRRPSPDVLKREGVAISMDGRGRALDNIFVERLWRNVKYEDVYLKGYANMAELTVGLAQYFAFYNAERPHQSLGYQTPDHVYRSGVGGGALIVDKFGDDDETTTETKQYGAAPGSCEVEMGTA